MLDHKRVYARINLDNIRYNYEQIEKAIRPGTKIMPVVKADGYGHGAYQIAKALSSYSTVYGYAVATIDEAIDIDKIGLEKPVLVLSYVSPGLFEEAIRRDIRLTVFDDETAFLLNECAAKLKKKAIVHIKVDTGMSRIGISADEEGLSFVQRTAGYDHLEIEGMFTHFARADEVDKTAVRYQIVRFTDFLEHVKQKGIHIPVKHCSNSASIIELPEMNLDVVRAGIILYGLWPSDEVSKSRIDLRPAMEICSSISFIKDVPAGTQISYGGTYVTRKKSRIATVSVGYADGYPRNLSNKGVVLVKGKRFPVVGRVCMDQMMIDISGHDEIKRGDLVTLVGRDGDEYISMEDFASLSDRINYEAVCDIGKRVPRIYEGE